MKAQCLSIIIMSVVYSFLAGCPLSAAPIHWDFRGCESYDPMHGLTCELIDEKDYDRDIVKLVGHDLFFPLSSELLTKLQRGQVVTAYANFDSKEFQKEFSRLPSLAHSKSFISDDITALVGLFVIDPKDARFFEPNYFLQSKVLKRIGRKIRVLSQPLEYSVKVQKHIKHKFFLYLRSTSRLRWLLMSTIMQPASMLDATRNA